jgi:hypothetical protein
MDALAVAHDAAVQMIDTSIVRVHQHGACITMSPHPKDSLAMSLLGANGSRECAPDDRLRDEAIQLCACGPMDCFASLAMTER